jgi:hypothetical protein
MTAEVEIVLAVVGSILITGAVALLAIYGYFKVVYWFLPDERGEHNKHLLPDAVRPKRP